ncbi:PGAP2-interacting protein-like [Ylistrum balloti]|uniref:PGAP2-interacting protein-like n=1 Tax=Ylistrum balloti TaxID=509963 RepID=UPI002905BEB1|nr:PGAP2-interacting protein-like [Ylistrum balloti]
MTSNDETKNIEHDSIRAICRETVHGYVFWSLFQGLGPMIWFYPLNELDISGYEAFVATWFFPLILGHPSVLRLVQNRWVLGVLRLLVVASLGSFQAGTTLSRLAILAFGAGISMCVFTATLWNPSPRIRTNTFWGLMLGLMLFVTSRIWYVSFIPTWWNDITNSAVIAIATVAVIDQVVSGADIVDHKVGEQTFIDRPRWFTTALGFGSLLYLTHWCFGEVSLITRWTVRGYPSHGPLPNPWGALVLLCLAMGVYLSPRQRLAQSKAWWLMGLVGFVALYYLPTWQGYAGGLVLAVYTMSIWPEMTDRLTLCPPARTLFVVMVVYLVEIFFFVWTVAYNFVPGGVYTREHTDYLILTVMTGIFLGLFAGGQKNIPSHTAHAEINNNSNVTSQTTNADTNYNRMPSRKVLLVLLVVTCTGLLGFASRFQSMPCNIKQNPVDPEKPRVFTAMIWTYHFGYDNQGWPSLERSANLIKDTGADVVTLLESDASKPFLGNNDLGLWLGEKLGMYVDFGPSTKDHTWGNLILSKYPIIKSTHHLLPSPHGELAPAVTASVNISGQAVDFVVTHMGNDRDILDRKLQAQFLAKELKKSPNPVIFLGYVTSAPGSRDYKQLLKKGLVKDIDQTDRDRWCEYIMYRDLIRLGYARITHGGLSDTEVQIAKFLIPEDQHDFKDNGKVTTDSRQVNKSLHFNVRFGSFHAGHGYFKGHKFHMDTPKYFLP